MTETSVDHIVPQKKVYIWICTSRLKSQSANHDPSIMERWIKFVSKVEINRAVNTDMRNILYMTLDRGY